MAKSQEHAAEKARLLLPEGTHTRAYVRGRANARVTLGAVVLVAVFGLTVFGAIERGGTAIPSPILLYLLYRSICPRRGLVVADQGVALMQLSFVSDRPKKVLALVPPAGIQQALSSTGDRSVRVGPDVVTVRRSDYPAMLGAIFGANSPISSKA